MKKVLLKPLAEETTLSKSTTDIPDQSAADGNPSSHRRVIPNGTAHMANGGVYSPQPEEGHMEPFLGSHRKISAPARIHLPTQVRNKHLDRVRGFQADSGPRMISSSTSLGGRRKRTTSNASEIWRSRELGSRSNLEQREFRRDISRIMYRDDIFYTGSVTSLATYQSNRSLKSYIDSNTSIPEIDPDEVSEAFDCFKFHETGIN